ncbi:MAG: PilT/PilU family type 4a pilus ATPase [Candidatus Methylopumilus sp.]
MSLEQMQNVVFDLLRRMVEKKASDLFLTAGFPPAIKLDGKMTPLTSKPLSAAQTQDIAKVVMNDKQYAEFEQNNEYNFTIEVPGNLRFRVNAFVQRSAVGLVFRTISKVPDFKSLGLPTILKDLALEKRGLLIFVGASGAGKSTSLAAMVDHRNEHTRGHIVSIEDPIEFVHEHKNCIVTQREIGVDTESWSVALKNSLRQAPDVILIGEIRDRETMDYAIAFAETGHLCMATLHANSTNQALDRIVNFFPEERRQQLLLDLSLNIRAFVSQRLIPNKDGKGRVAAVELMLNSPFISELILRGAVHEIKEAIAKSRPMGMQTFDQAVFDLHEAGLISYEEAIRNADSANDVRLKIKLDSKINKAPDAGNDLQGLGMI